MAEPKKPIKTLGKKRKYLTRKSEQTRENFEDVLAAFTNQKYFNEKVVVGNRQRKPDDPLHRSQCIRVLDMNKRNDPTNKKRVRDYRQLLPAQAAKWLYDGKVSYDTGKWQISHMCTSEKGGNHISNCVNRDHMRVESREMNAARRICQGKLRAKRNSFKFKPYQEGPLFLTSIGFAKNCSHRITDESHPHYDPDDEGDYPCFMNIGKANRGRCITGHVWANGGVVNDIPPKFDDTNSVSGQNDAKSPQ